MELDWPKFNFLSKNLWYKVRLTYNSNGKFTTPLEDWVLAGVSPCGSGEVTNPHHHHHDSFQIYQLCAHPTPELPTQISSHLLVHSTSWVYNGHLSLNIIKRELLICTQFPPPLLSTIPLNGNIYPVAQVKKLGVSTIFIVELSSKGSFCSVEG